MKSIILVFISVTSMSTSFSNAQGLKSFDDISLSMQLRLMWDCQHLVHQTFFRLKDMGFKAEPRNIKGVDNICKDSLTSRYDWSSKKSESEIDPNAIACLISRELEEIVLKKKYDKMDHIKSLCFPTAICRPDTSKDGYNYEKALNVYSCVKKHNAQNK